MVNTLVILVAVAKAVVRQKWRRRMFIYSDMSPLSRRLAMYNCTSTLGQPADTHARKMNEFLVYAAFFKKLSSVV